MPNQTFVFSKKTTRYLKDAVYEDIKKAIEDGQLPAGSRLLEADIAQQMGISRGPVRQALKVLLQEGFLYSHPSKGIVVAERNLEEREQVFVPIRKVIECYAANQASKSFTEEDYTNLEGIIDSIRRACEENDFEEIMAKDFSFHNYIISHCASMMLVSIWETITAQVNARILAWGMELESFEGIAEEHAEQLAAIRSGDEQRIDETISKYIY